MVNTVNGSAPIFPGMSLGNIELGIYLKDLPNETIVTLINDSFDGSTEYEVIGLGIVLGVHSLSGKVFRITAMSGYKGLLYGKYKVGSSIDELILTGCWYFSEEQSGMIPKSGENVIISIDKEDPSFEDMKGKNIQEISIYVSWIDNLDEVWI